MNALSRSLVTIGHFSRFTGQIAVRLFTSPWFGREAIDYLWTTAIRCLVPVVAVTLPFGMVVALEGLAIFKLFGAERLLASLISIATLRELSPVLASVLVAAQGGSSCAAELGAMRIKEELDATEVMAVDALRFHVVPRVLGITVACPLLNVAGNVAGLAGGYITAVLIKGESGGVFLAELWSFTSPLDLWSGLVKTAIFGLVIGLVSAYNGYHTRGGAAGVGHAVNDTVVYSVLVFIAINYFLTTAFFGGRG